MQSRLTIASAVTALALLACFGAWVTDATPESPPTNPSIALTESLGPFTHKDGWCFEAIGSGVTQSGASSNAFGGWREAWSIAPARIPKALVRYVKVTLDDKDCDSTYSANAEFCHVCVEMGASPKRSFSNFSFTGQDAGTEFPASPLGTATATLTCNTPLGANDGGQAPDDGARVNGNPAAPSLNKHGQYAEFFIARDVVSTKPSVPAATPPLLWIGEGQALESHNVCVEVRW